MDSQSRETLVKALSEAFLKNGDKAVMFDKVNRQIHAHTVLKLHVRSQEDDVDEDIKKMADLVLREYVTRAMAIEAREDGR